MDKLTKFLYEISYRFPKGYPDVNNRQDYNLLVELLKEQDFFKKELQEEVEDKGYHIGSLMHPSETLESRNWFFGSKVGYLGTGYYFYGSFEEAMRNYVEKDHGVREDNVITLDLVPYNLYKPTDAEKFYDDIKVMTRNLGLVSKDMPEGFLNSQDFEESVDEYFEILHDEHGINVSRDLVKQSMKSFIEDVQNKQEGVMFSNRILEPLGYDGIDNRNTSLDNFGVGSLLFHIKD